MKNQQIFDYIQQQRLAGISDEVIQNNLVDSGWTVGDVAAEFSDVQSHTSGFTVTNIILDTSPSKMLTLSVGIMSGLIVLGGVAYYFGWYRTSFPDSSSSSVSMMLQCPGVKILMPEKWTVLAIPNTSKLDADGCSKNSTGCLCARKDNQHPSKSVVFSTLVSEYPADLTLDMVVANVKSVLDVKKFDFRGYPAVQYTEMGTNSKTVTTAFLKDHKLYKFDFAAYEDTFNILWPDMERALEGIEL